jgi:hypothetical protein
MPPAGTSGSQEPAAIRAREHSEARPKTVNGPVAEPLAITAAMQVSGRRPCHQDGRVHRRLSTGCHGRAVLAACSSLTCAAELSVDSPRPPAGFTVFPAVRASVGVVRVEVTDRAGSGELTA